jgi:hypothetical protein
MKLARAAIAAIGIAAAIPAAAAPAAGSRVICPGSSAVYLIGGDGKRHVFPNERTYKTWHADFNGLQALTASACAAIPLGINVTARPGARLVKIATDPKVYALSARGTLRWIETEAVARALYGPSWNTMIDDVPDVFFADYAVGASIAAASQYDRNAEMAACSRFDACGATTTAGLADAAAIVSEPAFPLPAFDSTVTEPSFGTKVRRITDRVSSGGFATHIYSQLQAFSSDNAYVLISEDDYVVRRLDTLARSPLDLGNINAPHWQPAVSHTLVYYDTNEDDTIRVRYGNADTGAISDQFTFPSNYARIRGNQSFDELSRDGRWMAGMAAMAGGGQTIFSLDLASKKLGAQLSLSGLYAGPCPKDPEWGEVEPDWIGVSPSGAYLVVQWARDGTRRCSGLETFDISTGAFVGRVYDGHQHGDLGTDAQGDFFMTFESTSADDNNRPSQGLRRLPGPATGVAAPTYLQTMDWGNQSHISCQGPDGVCLVTAGSDGSNGWGPFEGELFLQYADGRVLRLAHHRSTSCGYWVQPRASLSRDGRYAIFTSDWGVNRCASSNDDLGRGEVYVIDLTPQ